MMNLTNLVYLCSVLSLCVVTSVKGGEYEKIYKSDYKVSASYIPEIDKNRLTPTADTIVTECTTPNHDRGFCIEIKYCKILMDQIPNKEASSFLRASRCGPLNENRYYPKVCCGKYGNYKNVTSKEDKDDDIFPKSCGKQDIAFDRRIVGGTEAFLGEFPWMARIAHKNDLGLQSIGCSGFLIHPNFIVTAAHCTHSAHTGNRGPADFVVLGEHNTKTKIDCSTEGTVCARPNQIRRIAKVTNHPDYDPQNAAHHNDIAIIHLKRAAQMSKFVQPICLSKDDSTPTRYHLSGWGKTEKVLHSQTKMRLEVPSFDKEECKRKYSSLNIFLEDTQICAGGEQEKDSCTGDSGGPLMMVSDDETWYASGVVSFGVDCGKVGWPGVYTDIARFVPWIKSEMVLNMRRSL